MPCSSSAAWSLLWLAVGLPWCRGSACSNNTPQTLQLNNVYIGHLPTGCTVEHGVSADQLQSSPCGASNSSSYLRFEYWAVAPDGPLSSGDGLMVVSQGVPARGSYREASDTWSLTSPSGNLPLPSYVAAADWANFRLLRGYQHLTLPVRGASSSSWFVVMQNVDIWVRSNLTYALRATCIPEPVCPSGTETPSTAASQVCNGHGSCRAASHVCAANHQPCALCDCMPGWGDIACNAQLQILQQHEGLTVQEPLEPGTWLYYDLQLPMNATQLLVELQRMSGDPVLFVKPVSQGFQPGGLPTVHDYNTYAAKQYFAERSNVHHMHFTNLSESRYYIAVYNHDAYLREGAKFELDVDWTADPEEGICPGNCSGRGRCEVNGTCTCSPGWVGEACDSTVQDILLGATAGGGLVPGQWTYFRLQLGETDADRLLWGEGLILLFHASGGHPVLVAAHEKLPSLGGTDLLFTWRKMWSGEQRFYIKGADLQPGTWYIGVFNLDYYTHSRFDFLLSVDSSSLAGRMMAPFASVGFGVSASLFLFALFSVFRRILWERHLARMAAEGGGPQAARNVMQGVPAEVINSFPSRPYKADEQPGSPHSTTDSENEPHCTVCLCEYEDGEMIRGLPCGHDFHLKCIDLWLGNHRTCPICRGSVVPDDETTFEGSQPADGQAQTGPAIEMLEVARQASTNASASPTDTHGFLESRNATTLTDGRTHTDTVPASPADSGSGGSGRVHGFSSLWGMFRLSRRSWTRMTSVGTDTTPGERALEASAVRAEATASGSVREDSFSERRDRGTAGPTSDTDAGPAGGGHNPATMPITPGGVGRGWGQGMAVGGGVIALHAGDPSGDGTSGPSTRGAPAGYTAAAGASIDQRNGRAHSWRTFYGGPRGPSIVEGQHEGDDEAAASDDDHIDPASVPREVAGDGQAGCSRGVPDASTDRHASGVLGARQWAGFSGLSRLFGRPDSDGANVPLRGLSPEDSTGAAGLGAEVAAEGGVMRQTSMAERFLGLFGSSGTRVRDANRTNVPISVPSQLV